MSRDRVTPDLFLPDDPGTIRSPAYRAALAKLREMNASVKRAPTVWGIAIGVCAPDKGNADWQSYIASLGLSAIEENDLLRVAHRFFHGTGGVIPQTSLDFGDGDNHGN